MPLIRSIIKKTIQNMTKSVVNWINGANSSKAPSYVPNLSIHLQGVGDSAALAFIEQMRTGFNSPFGSAISSALLKDYAQKTSVAGFFSGNQNTLTKYSSNPSAFVGGSWSQGGLGEWFALTGPTQNNPFILYQTAQNQAVSNVTQAQTNRRQDLVQSGGFLSLCPAGSTSSTGVKPQAPCTSEDGKPVQSVTPGSMIHAYATKAIADAGFDQSYAQLISANDFDSALSAVLNAVMDQVLGAATGLLGGGSPSSTSSGGGPRSTAITSALGSYTDSSTSASESASASGLSAAQSVLSNITTYLNSWQTIATAANTASSSAASLADFCTAAAIDAAANPAGWSSLDVFINKANTQATAARNAITSVIAPALQEAAAVASSSVIANTKALALKVQANSVAGLDTTASANSSAASTLSVQTQTLLTSSPTPTETDNAQKNASVNGGAIALPMSTSATPTVSLDVTGGSLVDRMNLISTNAQTLKTKSCTPVSCLGMLDSSTKCPP
ncbi:MAG: hypothetical protein PHV99_02915 [Candidatus Pacebacteria bacterium]|nr:hypothetical protein [Candidatus Paceibacterota bacterium]